VGKAMVDHSQHVRDREFELGRERQMQLFFEIFFLIF
jgi:hypothetical protein